MSAVLRESNDAAFHAESPEAADAEAARDRHAWLQQLQPWIPELQRAAIWLRSPDGALSALAGLPSLAEAYRVAPAGPRPGAPDAAVEPTLSRHDGIARIDFPICSDERGTTLVSLALADLPSLIPQRVIQQLHWGAGWLLRRGDAATTHALQERMDRARFAIDVGAAMLDQGTPHASAIAVVNLFARRFEATQVQMGDIRKMSARTIARSNAAWFDGRMHAAHRAEAAMNEALDERTIVAWPTRDGACPAAAAIADYAHEQKAGGIAVVPLLHEEVVHAVLLLERDRPFDDAEIESMSIAALSIAPIFAMQRKAAEGLLPHARRWVRGLVASGTDTTRPALKLAVVAAVAVLLAVSLLPVSHRVTAHSIVEGEVQRVAVAPFAGYVLEAVARAGDVVKAGQLLATLDDKDLRLERVRLESELEVSLRKEREAIAAGNRVDTRLAAAQSGQTAAQLDLVLEKLRRVRIVAPYDGVIVKGDLSQQIGSPVEQGKTLFEVAPLDRWRVVIEVDERDLPLVDVGQKGRLLLTSIPGKAFDLVVRRITAVSTPQDGRNFFRVEAQLDQPDPTLRPGLEGVAKVDVGDGAALAVWTRHFRHWLRIAIWEHLP